jgi:hypothetical protein
VPLERRKARGETAEHRVFSPSVRQVHVEHADLGGRSGIHARPEARREQLAPQAGAEEGQARAHGLAYAAALGHEPRVVRVVARAHRAAHHNHAVELAPVGKRLALVQLHPVQPSAALAHDVLVGARRLAGDVLKDKDGRAVVHSGRS